MTRNGEPIQNLQLRRKVNSGIAIESAFGVVSEFEEREASVFCHYNWTQWMRLPHWEKAACIAHYRLHLMIDAHVSDAVDRASKRTRKR